MKIDDFFGKGQIRADGRYVHDMYLMEVKKPSESTKPWDYYKMVKKLPAKRCSPPRPRASASTGNNRSAVTLYTPLTRSLLITSAASHGNFRCLTARPA